MLFVPPPGFIEIIGSEIPPQGVCFTLSAYTVIRHFLSCLFFRVTSQSSNFRVMICLMRARYRWCRPVGACVIAPMGVTALTSFTRTCRKRAAYMYHSRLFLELAIGLIYGRENTHLRAYFFVCFSYDARCGIS